MGKRTLIQSKEEHNKNHSKRKRAEHDRKGQDRKEQIMTEQGGPESEQDCQVANCPDLTWWRTGQIRADRDGARQSKGAAERNNLEQRRRTRPEQSAPGQRH